MIFQFNSACKWFSAQSCVGRHPMQVSNRAIPWQRRPAPCITGHHNSESYIYIYTYIYPICWWKLVIDILNFAMFMGCLHSLTSLRCFCPHTFFVNNGLDLLPWTSLISELHFEDISQQHFIGVANDYSCGVWYRGWTTNVLSSCMLVHV